MANSLLETWEDTNTVDSVGGTLVLGSSQYSGLFFLGCNHRNTLAPELLHTPASCSYLA